jgi:uncharacterized protein YsxB (DUF464 family)
MDSNLNVILYRCKDLIIGFKISGHANYDDYGKDIVCAAVSVLAQTTISSVIKLTDLIGFEYKIDSGHTFIKIKPENINENAELLLKSFELGVMGIKESYNNYINIIQQEVNLNDKRI